MRKKTVRLKLNTIKTEFRDKNVLLIDDSIGETNPYFLLLHLISYATFCISFSTAVRGTTSTEIVQMAREAGAKRVYFASAAPPVRYSNVYGIDIPTRSELIAHGRTEEEVAEIIGADMVMYVLS